MKLPKLTTIVFLCISICVLLFIGYKIAKKIKLFFPSSLSMSKQIKNKSDDNNNENEECIKDRIDMNCLLKDDNAKNLITIVPKIKKDKIRNLINEVNKDTHTNKQIIMSAKRKSRKKTDNTLRKIINTILSNSSVRSLLKIDETEKFTKTYYKSVMINLGLEPGNMKIKDMLQTIMISLPPISIIEDIIDENLSLNSMSNKEDRECVVLYLEKKIQ